MTEERRHSNVDWPNWLHEAWNGEAYKEGSLWAGTKEEPEKLYVGTLEGSYPVVFDDWIIRGIKHELYPCKPDIFEATYDVVE